jgi:hypothetical protein
MKDNNSKMNVKRGKEIQTNGKQCVKKKTKKEEEQEQRS